MVKSAIDHVIDMIDPSSGRNKVVNPYARNKPRVAYVPKPFVKRPPVPLKYMAKGWQAPISNPYARNKPRVAYVPKPFVKRPPIPVSSMSKQWQDAISKPRRVVEHDHSRAYYLAVGDDGRSFFKPKDGVVWYHDLSLPERLREDKKDMHIRAAYGGKPIRAYDDPEKAKLDSIWTMSNDAERQDKQLFLMGIDPAVERRKAELELAAVANEDLRKQVAADDEKAAFALIDDVIADEAFARIPKRRLKRPRLFSLNSYFVPGFNPGRGQV
jgi:hypothetical protein